MVTFPAAEAGESVSPAASGRGTFHAVGSRLPHGGRASVRYRSPGTRAQNTETPYALSASVTGWKNVVPPEEQLPLPPEVRPIARLPE